VQLIRLSPDILVEVLSFITHDSRQLTWYGNLCQSLRATLDEDSAWRHLCKRYWYATDQRLREWPSLSSQGLYRVLEQWTPCEGYYVLSPAFPWGLLVLVRIAAGQVSADVIRFVPRDDGSFSEVSISLFKVSFSEDRPGVVRSIISGACWGDAEILVSALDPQDLVARTEVAGFFPSAKIAQAGLFETRRALRLQSWLPGEADPDDSSDDDVAASGKRHVKASGYANIPRPSRLMASMLQGSSSDSEPEAACRTAAWEVGVLLESEELAQDRTEMMLKDMLQLCNIPCDLALLRGPEDFVPRDPGVPRIRPGLYVGDYGHTMYGQFRTEVLLLEHISLSADEMIEESKSPTRVFGRPEDENPPPELRELVNLHSEITFMRGVKQCGDFHVPIGATTFVAVCGPPAACSALDSFRCPAMVLNRQTRQMEEVRRSWRGWGTLAAPGFSRPSWAGGWLVQVGDDAHNGDNRFGFVWDRNQDAVVLRWIGLQDSSPFLQRAWLPEDVR